VKYARVSAPLFLVLLLCATLLYSREISVNEPSVPERNISSAKLLTAFERQLLTLGFVDIQEIDPAIKVELKYASAANFMGINAYGDFKRGYLRREAAEKLAKASRLLKAIDPDLSLLVVDAVRPRHIQRKMRKLLEGTPMQNYVAHPGGGSMHNYGCAVDITIVDRSGNRLDMGTPMDHFGILAQPRHEARFLREGKLTPEHIANRRLLRKVMRAAGFYPLPIEWWHFDAFDKKVVRRTYTIVE
jgi:D-alanyl-D-alanine dipeptidase